MRRPSSPFPGPAAGLDGRHCEAHRLLPSWKRRGRHLPLDPDWDAPAPEAGDVQGIVDLIRALPEQYRTILELKFLWEWTDRAIAQAVGLSVDAVSARVSRGRKLLQKKLTRGGIP